MAWNWTQGPLWGMNVSGMTIKRTVFTSTPQGPDLLSGGAFGAEGSLIASALIVGLSWYLWKAEWLKPSEEMTAIWSKYPAGYGLDPEGTEEIADTED